MIRRRRPLWVRFVIQLAEVLLFALAIVVWLLVIFPFLFKADW